MHPLAAGPEILRPKLRAASGRLSPGMQLLLNSAGLRRGGPNNCPHPFKHSSVSFEDRFCNATSLARDLNRHQPVGLRPSHSRGCCIAGQQGGGGGLPWPQTPWPMLMPRSAQGAVHGGPGRIS